MRKLFPILLLAGLAMPLIGCGKKDEAKMDDAKEKVDEAAGAAADAADAVEHGTKSGDKDHMGDGEAEGGGTKHE